MDWSVRVLVRPSHSYVETLPSSVQVLEGGALER